MKHITLITLVILIILVAAFAVYNYTISIYEVIYKVTPDVLYADGRSEITIQAVPVNGIGGKALFRDVEAEYSIDEGSELVDIVEYDKSIGKIRLKAKLTPGIVKITAKSSYALLPSLINVEVYPNIVEVIHEVNEII